MSSPVPMFGTQNLDDDDGQVIDSFLIETDTPPDPKAHLETIPVLPAVIIPRTTRIISGTVVFGGGESPQQLVPVDANRQQLHLDILSNASPLTFTDFVLIADEVTKLANTSAVSTSQATRGRSGKGMDFDEHTGALWVVPGPGITNAIEVTWRAVTS